MMNVKTLKTMSLLSLGILGSLVPFSSVFATEITGGQAMSFFASQEGYAFLIDTLRLNNSLSIQENEKLTWASSFSDSGSSFTSSGLVGGKQLNLSYTGSFSGVPDVENLTWSGTWSGSLDSNPISATDYGSFILGADGSYTDLLFEQTSSFSSNSTVSPRGVSPTVSGFEKLIAVVGGGVLGWLFPGALIPQTVLDGTARIVSDIFWGDPFPPGTGTETGGIGGKTGGRKGFESDKRQKPPTLPPIDIAGGGDCTGSSCFATGTLVAVPEPLTILGAATAVGFGASFKRRLAKVTKENKNS
jgi:hypothetical protein